MSRFEKCPKNQYSFATKDIHCDGWVGNECEGCALFTSYQIGRADAFLEVLQNMKGETNGNKD